MNKKVFILMFILLLIVGCGNKKENSTNKENKAKNTTSELIIKKEETLLKEQEVDGIKAKNLSIYIEDGVSYLSVDMVNDTEIDYTLNGYTLIIKDKDNKEIIKLPGYVGEIIKAGKTKTLKSVTNTNLKDAYSIEYQINK